MSVGVGRFSCVGVEDPAEARKARGAFFTPAELCGYLADWAITAPGAAVLEPSCGEAAFLVAAARRLAELGAGAGGRLHGVDVHAASVEGARAALAAELGPAAAHRADFRVADFFTLEPEPVYDAVIGNPPFVRYQEFTGEARARSRAAALRAGVSLTRLASSWAAFTVHAALFLRPGGRLALVLPAELLSVNYAAEVRRFLMHRFGRVRLVLFTERVFPGVLEEVVLLLAEGEGPTDHCELLQAHDVADLLGAVEGPVHTWTPSGNGKWTSALLPAPAREVLTGLTGQPGAGTLHAWGETTLGAVTGNNRYFTLSAQQIAHAALEPGDLVPISPPGSRHLRGLAFTSGDRHRLAEQGKPVWLFRPEAEPSRAARRFIRAGEQTGVPDAYKCRVRTPWWRVPLVPPADLLLTYMNADTPRLTTNRAGVRHLNSVHGLYLHAGRKRLGADLLPLAALNSLTLLGAEIVGRAYGGGMLKLEPREADGLPVPSPVLVGQVAPALRALRPAVAGELANGRLLGAVALVDEVVLNGGLNLEAGQVKALAEAREQLAGRRAARGRSARER
jgi:adenine-specific DNA-methyltransferase